MNEIKLTPKGKVTVIDRETYEEFLQKPKSANPIRNVKYRKSKETFNLLQYVKTKSKIKKKIRRKMFPIYTPGKISGKRSKHRCTRLKKFILKKRHSRTKSEGNIELTEKKESHEFENVVEQLEDLTVGAPKNIRLHSRRFRDYCDNTTSKDLSKALDVLLRELHRFQKRAYLVKGRCRRRIVIGFREVQAQLRINKLKLVVIATDCERCDGNGGLDDIIIDIREECRSKAIPCAFAMLRRELSYTLFVKGLVGCVGVLDYDGAQDLFSNVLNILEAEKINYCKIVEGVNKMEST